MTGIYNNGGAAAELLRQQLNNPADGEGGDRVALPGGASASDLTRDAAGLGGALIPDPASRRSLAARVGSAAAGGADGMLRRFGARLAEYRHDLRPPLHVVGIGSSVGEGATIGGALSADAPVNYLVARLREKLDPAGLFDLVSANRSVGGGTLSDGILTQLPGAIGEGLTMAAVVDAFGMNDGLTSIYNSGQTYPFVRQNTVALAALANANGADYIVLTTPHPHSGRTDWSMAPGIDQIYPTAVPAPVSDVEIEPPASQSIVTADWCRNGQGDIPASHRHWRVNQARRLAAAEVGAIVIDVERHWFLAVQRHGEDALFNAGESVHPNLLGHQLSYHAAIDEALASIVERIVQGAGAPRRGRYRLNVTGEPAATHVVQSIAFGESPQQIRNSAGDVLVESKDDGRHVVGLHEWQLTGHSVRILGEVRESEEVLFWQNISVPVSILMPAQSMVRLEFVAEQSGIGQHAGEMLVQTTVSTRPPVVIANDQTLSPVVVFTPVGSTLEITPVGANTNLVVKLRRLLLP